jgi:crotonobetainyl-CoA:carnitine CoA-transferase CaiB-like acyl-CoA transferase
MTSMLEGIRVVDLTQSISGPFCTLCLADMGAEVIKIEKPDRGEDVRYFPPVVGETSGAFVQFNHSKKGVTLNLKSPEGVGLFKELVRAADIVVENFTPGAMAKLGIAYGDLKEINPKLIMCSISGFGQTGPLAPLPGYDTVIQALSGLMSTTGFHDGPPVRTGSIVVDVSTGMVAATAICASLFRRERTGEGDYLDIAMFDVALNLLEVKFVEYTTTREIPGRFGNRYPTVTPFDAFPTKDEYAVICCAGDNTFQNLCKAMEMPELAEDERFRGNLDRNRHEPELRKIIEEWSGRLTSRQVIEKLLPCGVPVATIKNVKEAVENPQTAAREMLVDVIQPGGEKFTIYGSAIKSTNSKVEARGPAPGHGEHNEWLLREVLNKSDEEVEKILGSGAMVKQNN